MVTAHLLIVEDDPDLLRVLSLLLQRANLAIDTAQSAQSAILACQRQLPHLIILDLGLSQSQGLDLLEWLRQSEISTLPVLVIYTARDLFENELQDLQAFTSHIFTKSRISPTEFRQQIFALLDEQVERSHPSG
ncbi:MAG: response regulator [Thermostichus sp. HHBFW_bins_43]